LTPPPGFSKAEWHCCLPPGSLVTPVVHNSKDKV
jgi:hypothetical protein